MEMDAAVHNETMPEGLPHRVLAWPIFESQKNGG